MMVQVAEDYLGMEQMERPQQAGDFHLLTEVLEELD